MIIGASLHLTLTSKMICTLMTFNIIAIFYFQFQAFLIIRNGKPAPLQCVKIKADHTILRMYINNIIGQGGQSIFCGIV